jgi:hypothetical protein
MSERSLLAVFIRAFGLWFAFSSLGVLAMWMTEWLGDGRAFESPYVSYVATSLVAAVLCLGLADRIAALLYPSQAEPTVSLDVRSGDVWRFACYVVGLYALLSAAQALVRVGLLLFARPDEYVRANGFPTHALAEFVLLLLFGVVLIAGPRRVLRLFGGTHSDAPPESGHSASRDAR